MTRLGVVASNRFANGAERPIRIAVLSDETVYSDELAPNIPVLAEVTPGHWVKVVERKPAKT